MILMKYTIFTFLLASWILLVFPVITSAQGVNPNSLPYTGFNNDFNFWWVLPLVTLPLALWVLARSSNGYPPRDEISYHQVERPRRISTRKTKKSNKRR
jgi:hypothetical protein